MRSSAQHHSPIKAKVRIFHPLFKSKNPLADPDGILADISERSEEICRDVFLDIGFDEVESRAPWPKRQPEAGAGLNHEAQPDEVFFQGMRLGYF